MSCSISNRIRWISRRKESVIGLYGSTWVPGHRRQREERTKHRRLQGNHDESPNPMCAPARSITRGVHHTEPPSSFLPARGPRLVPRLTFEITDLYRICTIVSHFNLYFFFLLHVVYFIKKCILFRSLGTEVTWNFLVRDNALLDDSGNIVILREEFILRVR